VVVLNKESKATKCSENCTISLIAYTAKMVSNKLRRRIEKVIEYIFEEDQFRTGRKTGTMDAIVTLKILS
jgi:hypothetical protein